MNYPLPFWSAFTPVLPFSDYMNYWNRYTAEERLKRICEELWKLEQAYQLLTAAINDHEERIAGLEETVADHETRIAAIELELTTIQTAINTLVEQYNDIVTSINAINTHLSTIDTHLGNVDTFITNTGVTLTTIIEDVSDLNTSVTNLITNLPTMITDIVNTYVSSPTFIADITEIVNTIAADKIDKATGHTDELAILLVGGGVDGSGKKVGVALTPHIDSTHPVIAANLRDRLYDLDSAANFLNINVDLFADIPLDQSRDIGPASVSPWYIPVTFDGVAYRLRTCRVTIFGDIAEFTGVCDQLDVNEVVISHNYVARKYISNPTVIASFVLLSDVYEKFTDPGDAMVASWTKGVIAYVPEV